MRTVRTFAIFVLVLLLFSLFYVYMRYDTPNLCVAAVKKAIYEERIGLNSDGWAMLPRDFGETDLRALGAKPNYLFCAAYLIYPKPSNLWDGLGINSNISSPKPVESEPPSEEGTDAGEIGTGT